MAWIGPDHTYTFTIARLLEGEMILDNLTVNGINLIVGGVDQGITPAIHLGDTVTISMRGKNVGRTADNFVITCQVGVATPESSPTFTNIAINGITASWSPSSFIMPDANVSVTIRTFHEE